MKEKLSQEHFDAIFDNNGRELSDTQPLAERCKFRPVQHFVYMSSAGCIFALTPCPHVEAT